DLAPFALAGIWTSRRVDDGEEHSFAILTRPSAPSVQALHDRMPHIVAPEQYAAWLAPDNADPAPLLDDPYGTVACYPVSTYVNKPAHNDAACLERVSEPSRA